MVTASKRLKKKDGKKGAEKATQPSESLVFETVNALVEELDRRVEANPQRPTVGSLKQYASQLAQINTFLSLPPTPIDLSAFSDVKTVTDAIENAKLRSGAPYSQNSKALFLASLKSVLKHFPSMKTLEDAYGSHFSAVKSEIDAQRMKNQITDKDVIMDWDEVQTRFKNAVFASPEDRAILALYVLTPPRRIKDYTQMLVVQKGMDTDPSFNYLVIGDRLYFVFNQYKTSRHYGSTTEPLPNALAIALVPHLENVEFGDFLFEHKAYEGGYSEPEFSRRVSNLTEKYLGKRMSVNNLRHSIISSMHKADTTSAQKATLAKKMGHSTSEADLYRKIPQS